MKTITIFCSSKQNLNQVYKNGVTNLIEKLDTKNMRWLMAEEQQD